MLLHSLALQAALLTAEAEKAALDAFKGVCWAVPDAGRVADNALEQGWTAVPRGKHAWADRLRDGIEGGADDGYRVAVQQFERLVGGRLLLLTINRGELTAPAAEGFGSTNCLVRELSEARELSMPLVEEWLGRPADEAAQDEAGAFSLWYSHRRHEPTILTVAYFPPGSRLAGEEMMPGIYLNAEAHGDGSEVRPLGGQPATLPGRAMLDAFKAACARVDAFEAMKTDAAASGWEAIAEDADPRVERLNRIGRESLGGDGTISGATYRRTVEDRQIFLIVSRYEDRSGYWGNGCRVYDFAATAPVDPAALEAWMGRAPTGVEDFGAGVGRRLWEPGWRDGLTVEITHVPPGHPMAEAFGVEGNVLIAQAIGGF